MLFIVLMDSIYHRDMHWTRFQSVMHFLVRVGTFVAKCKSSVAFGGKCHFAFVLLDAWGFWVLKCFIVMCFVIYECVVMFKTCTCSGLTLLSY